MPINLKDPKYYFNRELSWIQFNERVLYEALDETHPLIERLKFIAIFSSNLDEFFMIRVGGLKQQIDADIRDIPIDGLEPEEQVSRISTMLHPLVARQAKILEEVLLPELTKQGIVFRKVKDLSEQSQAYLKNYFHKKVYPVLTPLAIDTAHPFPQLPGLAINLLVKLREPNSTLVRTAVVQIPSSLRKFISVPSEGDDMEFVFMENLVAEHLEMLFPYMEILRVASFRFTRNADLDLSEAEADDLLKHIERELRKRRVGAVVRIEVTQGIEPSDLQFLKEVTGIYGNDIYIIPTYLDLTILMKLLKLNKPHLKDVPFTPSLHKEFVNKSNIFDAIKEKDILLQHPYYSFMPVVEFVETAANDPNVLAIKQTLYRTSGDSAIVRALRTAVGNGKQVTALIELKARFDEENNIEWAKHLDNAGVNVVYGVLGLKTHCKICMVVRREGEDIKRYLHVGTGNYNSNTAKLYTDIGLMTCDEDMGEDATELFNLLTGYSLRRKWNKFLIAPTSLRSSFVELIHECVDHQTPEQPSRIMVVINSLVDPKMIQELYRASQRGVKIDMIIRGICCLKPGIPGISENITVKSIVGRFLEHPRIFYFESKGQSKIFCGSADWMTRNLNRRVELVFPILDEDVKAQVSHILKTMWKDNVKSHYLHADGSYKKLEGIAEPFSAQEYFLAYAQKKHQEVDTTMQAS